jgi:hypothetical protein
MTRPTVLRRRPLTIREILRWADAYHQTAGKWPTSLSGDVMGATGETWANINAALRLGLRDLPGGSSLARLLAEHRGARNPKGLPHLSCEQILAWADAYHRQEGQWPTVHSGLIPASGGERWANVNRALERGLRGLPGGSSLARLLAERRGAPYLKGRPPFSLDQILGWADAHHQRTGEWPTRTAGEIAEAPGETWSGVESALRYGLRGLAGGSSLALLLADRRGVRNLWTRPDLAVPQILAWADAFHERCGRWPDAASGPIAEAPGETWNAVESALRRGRRGLAAGLSLARLLAEHRGVRNRAALPRLRVRQVLAWADAHFRRTDAWPTADLGPIPEAPGETWHGVNQALIVGGRGLRGGSSLARLLAERRGRRNRMALPRLSKKKIVAWADAHFGRTGTWPNINSGPVQEAPGETWGRINQALRQGLRGLEGGTSLFGLLQKKRGLRNPERSGPASAAAHGSGSSP